MRINKYIAANTIFSRRKADELIKNGKVSINGKQTLELGLDINPEKDKIGINNKLIKQKTDKIYLALNKPKGYITTLADEHGRRTVMLLVPPRQNLKPVGRLDMDTEGLLLFSNDGEFINRLTHPKFECEKEYYAKIEGELTKNNQKKLEEGIIIDDTKTSKAKINIIKTEKKRTLLTMTIHEGRNRQIRKMFDSIHHPVEYLQRIRIGRIKLGNLQKGKYRLLTTEEINANKST